MSHSLWYEVFGLLMFLGCVLSAPNSAPEDRSQPRRGPSGYQPYVPPAGNVYVPPAGNVYVPPAGNVYVPGFWTGGNNLSGGSWGRVNSTANWGVGSTNGRNNTHSFSGNFNSGSNNGNNNVGGFSGNFNGGNLTMEQLKNLMNQFRLSDIFPPINSRNGSAAIGTKIKVTVEQRNASGIPQFLDISMNKPNQPAMRYVESKFERGPHCVNSKTLVKQEVILDSNCKAYVKWDTVLSVCPSGKSFATDKCECTLSTSVNKSTCLAGPPTAGEIKSTIRPPRKNKGAA